VYFLKCQLIGKVDSQLMTAGQCAHRGAIGSCFGWIVGNPEVIHLGSRGWYWGVGLYEAMQLIAVVVLDLGLLTPSNATSISVNALCRDCRVQPRGQRRKRGCGTYPQEIIHRSEEWNFAS
jgi:hypothetical protein